MKKMKVLIPVVSSITALASASAFICAAKVQKIDSNINVERLIVWSVDTIYSFGKIDPSSATQSITQNTTFGDLSLPTITEVSTGCHFMGWYDEATGKKFSDDTSIECSEAQHDTLNIVARFGPSVKAIDVPRNITVSVDSKAEFHPIYAEIVCNPEFRGTLEPKLEWKITNDDTAHPVIAWHGDREPTGKEARFVTNVNVGTATITVTYKEDNITISNYIKVRVDHSAPIINKADFIDSDTGSQIITSIDLDYNPNSTDVAMVQCKMKFDDSDTMTISEIKAAQGKFEIKPISTTDLIDDVIVNEEQNIISIQTKPGEDKKPGRVVLQAAITNWDDSVCYACLEVNVKPAFHPIDSIILEEGDSDYKATLGQKHQMSYETSTGDVGFEPTYPNALVWQVTQPEGEPYVKVSPNGTILPLRITAELPDDQKPVLRATAVDDPEKTPAQRVFAEITINVLPSSWTIDCEPAEKDKAKFNVLPSVTQQPESDEKDIIVEYTLAKSYSTELDDVTITYDGATLTKDYRVALKGTDEAGLEIFQVIVDKSVFEGKEAREISIKIVPQQYYNIDLQTAEGIETAEIKSHGLVGEGIDISPTYISGYTGVNFDASSLSYKDPTTGKTVSKHGDEAFDTSSSYPIKVLKDAIADGVIDVTIVLTASFDSPYTNVTVECTDAQQHISGGVKINKCHQDTGNGIWVNYKTDAGYQLDTDAGENPHTFVKYTDTDGQEHTIKLSMTPGSKFTIDASTGYLFFDAANAAGCGADQPITIAIGSVKKSFPVELALDVASHFASNPLDVSNLKLFDPKIKFQFEMAEGDTEYTVDEYNSSIEVFFTDDESEIGMPVSFTVDPTDPTMWEFEWNYQWIVTDEFHFKFHVASIEVPQP